MMIRLITSAIAQRSRKDLTKQCSGSNILDRPFHDQGRFIKALSGVVGKSLKYAKLIAAAGGDGPYPTTDARQTT